MHLNHPVSNLFFAYCLSFLFSLLYLVCLIIIITTSTYLPISHNHFNSLLLLSFTTFSSTFPYPSYITQFFYNPYTFLHLLCLCLLLNCSHLTKDLTGHKKKSKIYKRKIMYYNYPYLILVSEGILLF